MMGYREFIRDTFNSYKCKSKTDEYRTIPIYNNGVLVGFLKPVTYLYKIIKPHYINLICQWREENEIGFANKFHGTHNKTENWIDNMLLPREDRILFMVHTLENVPVGHLGFSSFNFETRSCEVDNVVRGVKGVNKGIMSAAMNTLIEWGKQNLDLQKIYLRVLADNPHAIKFYQKLGFEEVERIPLYKRETKDLIEWVEDEEFKKRKPARFHICMKLLHQDG